MDAPGDTKKAELAALGQLDVALLDEDPYDSRLGTLAYPREVVERCLYEVAAHGGNARKAHQALAQLGQEVGWTPPSPETMYRWIKGRFRNRYHQICSVQSDGLREVIAREATDIALQLAAAERAAIRQTLSGLADMDALQASNVLRNLTMSKGMNLDKEALLRGRATSRVEVRGLAELAEALVKAGVAEHVDADAVEDAELVE